MQEMIMATWILVLLPFIGVVFAFIRMHHAIYNAETPTKKKQIMVLQGMWIGYFCYGLVEALVLWYGEGKSLSVLAALGIGSMSLIGAIAGGILVSKQLALGFMNHKERFHRALMQQVLVSILPIVGLILFLILS